MNDREYKKIEDYLVGEAKKKLNISDRAARLRVRAIVKSGILERFGTPDTMTFKVAIDAAMQIPQLADETQLVN